MRWRYLLGGVLAACGPVPGSDDTAGTVASSGSTTVDVGVVLYRSEGEGFTPCLVGAGRFAEAADFDEDGRLDLLLADDAALTLARLP